MEEIVFSQYTIDFARVALEYCIFVEKTRESDKKTFTDNMTKILPLLYIKASIIPEITTNYESDLKFKINEDFYSQVETNISRLLGNDDLYVETFYPDTKLSDSSVAVKISEDLSDIYQDLGNFIANFKIGQKEIMSDALLLCVENFKKYWGQRLVNALRALHFINYRSDLDDQ